VAGAVDSWEVLERIGTYAAGELFEEEARQEVERLVLERTEMRRLADSYARLLTLLRCVGEERPEAPEVMIEDVLRRVVIGERRLPLQEEEKEEEERRHDKVRERKTSALMRTSEHEPEKDLGLVWISCLCEEEEGMVLLIKEALEENARVHVGKEPPRGEDPCCVLLCPNGKDVFSQMRHLQSQAPNLPVVVFCQSKELRLVEQALRAGASGFVHAQMRPKKIALALSLASQGEVFIPRELLGELIGRRLFLRRPRLLDP
jgi:hypothetical protein